MEGSKQWPRCDRSRGVNNKLYSVISRMQYDRERSQSRARLAWAGSKRRLVRPERESVSVVKRMAPVASDRTGQRCSRTASGLSGKGRQRMAVADEEKARQGVAVRIGASLVCGKPKGGLADSAKWHTGAKRTIQVEYVPSWEFDWKETPNNRVDMARIRQQLREGFKESKWHPSGQTGQESYRRDKCYSIVKRHVADEGEVIEEIQRRICMSKTVIFETTVKRWVKSKKSDTKPPRQKRQKTETGDGTWIDTEASASSQTGGSQVGEVSSKTSIKTSYIEPSRIGVQSLFSKKRPVQIGYFQKQPNSSRGRLKESGAKTITGDMVTERPASFISDRYEGRDDTSSFSAGEDYSGARSGRPELEAVSSKAKLGECKARKQPEPKGRAQAIRDDMATDRAASVLPNQYEERDERNQFSHGQDYTAMRSGRPQYQGSDFPEQLPRESSSSGCEPSFESENAHSAGMEQTTSNNWELVGEPKEHKVTEADRENPKPSKELGEALIGASQPGEASREEEASESATDPDESPTLAQQVDACAASVSSHEPEASIQEGEPCGKEPPGVSSQVAFTGGQPCPHHSELPVSPAAPRDGVHPPTTIVFCPTIVIVQNNLQVPNNLIASSTSLVNLQNQEVYIYPNSIQVCNFSLPFTQQNSTNWSFASKFSSEPKIGKKKIN